MKKFIRYDHALVVCLLLAGCGHDRKGSAANAVTSDSPGLHRDTAAIVPDTVITGISTAEFQETITPAEVLERFKAGNKRFLEGRMVHRNYLSQVDLSAKGQHPFAVIVSCIDSRKPAEFIFDKGIGDMFNVRIAGNFINRDILGSLEFACKVSGAKLILIMGHSDCGAIKSACDKVKLGNITAMLDNILPAVKAVKDIDGPKTSKNKAFVAAVAKNNVVMGKENILKESPILREMVEKGQVLIETCMYDLQTGSVEFY